ncbi:hypothetical protein HWQ46_18665 [Shewanella sp. D64]|uniref:hypothetical protein n=1 Tax=unclassified Shewanella TaxID=196818 RepID=UPI0022BA46DE|nr:MULTISPECIES: hypothetical protein [unclassified Shewanella]MEC4727571.1 hypothetical protein [Shewanella sp. D64]MEC4739822.1 hypothetical protein [Shewanella sp. E94]WBJ95791.1 hypothetical protein HWQ47_01230 [Shewanella sp. MTB7]
MDTVKSNFEFDAGIFQFKFGVDNEPASRDSANECRFFMPDDEDEQIDDTLISCYNCMNRRWLVDGMECLKISPT